MHIFLSHMFFRNVRSFHSFVNHFHWLCSIWSNLMLYICQKATQEICTDQLSNVLCTISSVPALASERQRSQPVTQLVAGDDSRASRRRHRYARIWRAAILVNTSIELCARRTSRFFAGRVDIWGFLVLLMRRTFPPNPDPVCLHD